MRTIAECDDEMAADITITTSLLEHRFVAGSRRAATARSAARSRRRWTCRRSTKPRCSSSSSGISSTTTPPTTSSRTSRKARAGCATCRRCCGSRARPASAARGASSPQAGLITPQEARTVSRQERLIGALRVRLHYLAGRREDRLVFDLQNALARELGLADTPARRASEQLMQRYYRAAKLVRQVNVILLQNLHARLFPIPTRARGRSTPISRRSTSCSTCATRSCSSAGPAAMLDAFLTHAAPSRAQGHVGAHAARAVAQPASRRRRVSAAIRRTARASSRSCASRAASRTSCAG